MFKFAATAILAIALCLGGRAIPPASGYEAGLATLSLTDPVEGGPMTAIVVYPTDADPKGGPPAVSHLGPFHVAAATGFPPAAGPFPLIVVSHGTGGSSLGHHDSATALARAGFVVASIEHPRDNYRDDSGFGTDIQLYGRPHHIVALIDALLASPVFGPRVDRGAGIGMAGHSAGGYTALAIAGAVPDLSLSAAYRAALPADTYGLRADTAGPFRRRPDLHPIADPRVRSIFIMAPALGYLFDKPGLADVRVPVQPRFQHPLLRLRCGGVPLDADHRALRRVCGAIGGVGSPIENTRSPR